MTKGEIEGGLRKFLDTPKGGSEKISGGGGAENLYTSKPTGEGGLLKNWTASEGGGGGGPKISSFEFQYLHPSLPPPPPLSY